MIFVFVPAVFLIALTVFSCGGGTADSSKNSGAESGTANSDADVRAPPMSVKDPGGLFAAQLEKLQKLKGWSAEEIKKIQDLSARAAAALE
jgi:hypothetical protein